MDIVLSKEDSVKLRYKIIIVFGAIVFGALIGLGFFKIFNHEQETNVNEKTQLSKYFLEYFNDTLEEEVSVEALIENGYISNTNENQSNIYVNKDNKIRKKETNSEKAKEIAKKIIVNKLKKLHKDLYVSLLLVIILN